MTRAGEPIRRAVDATQRLYEARDAAIVQMRGEGATLQAIADVYGISKERVRQIVARELSRG